MGRREGNRHNGRFCIHFCHSSGAGGAGHVGFGFQTTPRSTYSYGSFDNGARYFAGYDAKVAEGSGNYFWNDAGHKSTMFARFKQDEYDLYKFKLVSGAYAYDVAGRLSSVRDWVSGQTTFAYDSASLPIGVTYPNGVATDYSFDANSRLSGLRVGGQPVLDRSHPRCGWKNHVRRSHSAGHSHPGELIQTVFLQRRRADDGENFDAMGRALTENGRTYTWNLASQMTGFQDSVNFGTLTYDALGQLSPSTISGTAESFVFNPATTFPALSIVRQGESDLRYYVYTPDGKPRYSIESANKTRKFYHYDEMGNTTFLTGDDGSITDTYAITPYTSPRATCTKSKFRPAATPPMTVALRSCRW